MTFTLRGYNQWVDGKAKAPGDDNEGQFDERTMVLSSSGTGWSARAEFYAVSKKSASSDLTVKLSKWNFQTEEAPFKLNLWGRGHSLSDYQTPFVWVQHAKAAPADNWKARLTAKIFDGEAVFAIDNNTALYYAFYKKAFGNTTLGTAYKTNFNHETTASVYAISKLSGVTVTAEVANDRKPSAKWAPKYGLQGVFDFGLTLKGSYIQSAKQLTVEATQLMTDKLSRFYAKFYDNNFAENPDGSQQVVGNVVFRAKNDQDITRTFTTNDVWYNINNTGSNYWLVTTGWAVGANVTRTVNVKATTSDSFVLKLDGFYEPIPGKAKALATVNYTNYWNPEKDTTWNVWLRGYYKVNDKFTVHPRVIVDQTWVKAGTYVDYVINKGRVVGAGWYDYNRTDTTKNQERFELGWSLSL